MKKLSKLLMITLVMSILFILTSCFTDNTVKEYTVTFETDGGTIIEAVKVESGKKLTLPEDPEKEEYVFMGWYLDATFDTEVDNTYVVTTDITIYAKWEAVSEFEKIFVSSVSSRTEFVLFEENRKEKENKKTEFKDLEQAYVVGDDNAWQVKPNVAFVKLNTTTGAVVDAQPKVASWEYEVKVEVYDDATMAYVDGSEHVESIDKVNCTVDFKESAIGYKVRVSVVPSGLTEKQLANVEQYTTSFEAKVIDGYNAYKGLDLAFIENRNDDSSTTEAWEKFKEEKNIDKTYQPAAIILHTNIDIKASDLPEYFFYTLDEVKGASDEERANGSLKDNKNIYLRVNEAGKNFSIEGNYFTLSAKSIKEVVRENGNVTGEGEVISHTTLIRFEGSEDTCSTINNINLVGNAPRVENAIKSGGIILTKIEGPEFKAYNNIASAWFITYFPNYTNKAATMEKCKAYDAYNCFVYNWGSPLVYIKDCEMVGAGGPVIIQDHVDPQKEDGRVAKTYVTNSVLESYVAGTEGWFKGVGADGLVPQIKGLDQLFNYFGRSFLKTNADNTVTYFNFICINKSGSAEGITAEKIQGELKIDDNASFDFGASNPYLAAMLDNTFKLGAPTFQTSKGGFAYGTTTGLFDITGAQVVNPTNAVYQGEYICLYYQGMAITFGFNTFSQAGYEVHNA